MCLLNIDSLDLLGVICLKSTIDTESPKCAAYCPIVLKLKKEKADANRSVISFLVKLDGSIWNSYCQRSL